jgi:hypothetical protein
MNAHHNRHENLTADHQSQSLHVIYHHLQFLIAQFPFGLAQQLKTIIKSEANVTKKKFLPMPKG